jgi:hypothetical protein
LLATPGVTGTCDTDVDVDGVMGGVVDVVPAGLDPPHAARPAAQDAAASRTPVQRRRDLCGRMAAILPARRDIRQTIMGVPARHAGVSAVTLMIVSGWLAG